MKRWLLGMGLMAVMAAIAQDARADRTRSTRASGQRSFGAKKDLTVPYLNNGSAFQGYSVAPQVKSSKTVDDPANPQQKPVYNIIFYGAKQGFGSQSNGAVSK